MGNSTNNGHKPISVNGAYLRLVQLASPVGGLLEDGRIKVGGVFIRKYPVYDPFTKKASEKIYFCEEGDDWHTPETGREVVQRLVSLQKRITG